MARKVARRVYEYTLHAHQFRGNYRSIFESLRQVAEADLLIEVDRRRIFISYPKALDGQMFFRVLWVKEDRDFLRFNEANLEEVEDSLPRNDRFAVAAHALVVPDERKLFFEFVRGGPKADEFIAAVQAILREEVDGFARLSLTATPVYAGGFGAEVRRLERIRVVRLDLVRPNIDWADEADRLHELAAESNARKIAVEATAPPRESLNREDGIVAVVTNQVAGDMPHVERAIVEGQRPGETGTTTIRSDDHVKFDRVNVDTDTSGSANILSALAMMRSVLRRRRPNPRPQA
jgi:hypothetical protein